MTTLATRRCFIRYFPVIRFQTAIITERTAGFKQKALSRGDSFLRGCSTVTILPPTPREQRFRPVSAQHQPLAPTRITNFWLGHRRQPCRTNGGGTPNRWMRSRIAANNSRGTATSAIWNVTYLECRTTFAPILINFSLSVVNDQCFREQDSQGET